jgi:hypothetical protein
MVGRYCLKDDLSTYDPYDIWKTKIGFYVKNLYNCHTTVGLLPAGVLTVCDAFLFNRTRYPYRKVDYPIVRALAAQCLLNLNRYDPRKEYPDAAKMHLDWLVANACRGFHGYCWGLGWRYPVARGLVYDANAPYSTVTPYALEAFVQYQKGTGSTEYSDVIESIFGFVDKDVRVMSETDACLATSYGACVDRIAYNAISYTMYSLSLLLDYVPALLHSRIREKIHKMYNYIALGQAEEGAWYYSPDGESFIDCFHSCFVLKNLIKTHQRVPLDDSLALIDKGYEYLLRHFRDTHTGLFRRFSIANKPGIIRYDLYDNAEMLNLALLMGYKDLAEDLIGRIESHFHERGKGVYSKIDCFSRRLDLNTLRWAVLPYLFALSRYLLHA